MQSLCNGQAVHFSALTSHRVSMQSHSISAVRSSTIYPIIEILDRHSATLQPLVITVHFPGILPWNVIDERRGIVSHYHFLVCLELQPI